MTCRVSFPLVLPCQVETDNECTDHILTLQQNLAHYERLLSQSHPFYLSKIRFSVAKTKTGTDKVFMFLTILSMAVVCVQTLIGAYFS